MAGGQSQSSATAQRLTNQKLYTTKCRERLLAPAADFGVYRHPVPVLRIVPADPVFAVVLVNLGGAYGSGEVDQVYVLMPWSDVLELHPRGPVELHGLQNILALVAHKLHPQARLLEDVAYGRVIGELVLFYVSAGREPHVEFAVTVEENLALPRHEDRDREVPSRMLSLHEVDYKGEPFGSGITECSRSEDKISRRRATGRRGDRMSRLPAGTFRRYDETPDEEFYKTPRLVTHIDDRAIAAVTQLYRELFPAGGAILDLMSSWISHLPEEVCYRRVVGLGMNEEELKRNPRLDEYVVQNLNRNPELPFGEAEFDGVGICVSIDYLTRPVAVLREVGRVLKVGSPIVITFSNRCFPDKAVAIWLQLDDQGHVRLVEEYLREASNFENIRSLDRNPRRIFSDPLYAVIGESMGPV
jgi:hypothetical protein